MPSLLQIQNLTISLKRIPVVSNVSLTVNHGEVFGIAGESGCGKSLTALSILRLLPAYAEVSGDILYKGKSLLSVSEQEIRQLRGKEISMVFQEPMTSLNPVLTVGYQITETLLAHLKITKQEAKKRAIELLNLVQIPNPEARFKEYPHQLSGGMRQRVMIAIAMACSPSLLIADEPTTALDVTIQARILALLQELKQKTNLSVILITHDLSIMYEQADRLAIMYAGRIVELADKQRLFAHTMHPYTIGLMQSLPVAKGEPLKPIRGQVPPIDKLPAGCVFSNRCDFAKDDCLKAEPELKEVASNHFVRCIKAQ